MSTPHRPGVTGSSPVIRSMQLAMHGLFVLLLAVGTVRAVQVGDHLPWVVLACAAIALWYAAGLVAAPGARPLVGRVWLLGLVALWGVAVLLSAELSWVAFALFFLVLHLLPRVPALLVVAAITVVVIAVQLADGDGGSAAARVIGPSFGALVAIGVAWVYSRLREESEERRRLVHELTVARDDLLSTYDELAVAQRQAGVLAERSRLARDIHDTLAQGFSSIVLLSRAGLAGDAVRLRGLIEQIERTAATGLADARTVVQALTPDELEEAPLPAALGRLLDRLHEQTGIRTDLVVDGEPRALPTAVEVALLRIAQGALANVRQHAAADRVTLTITYQDDATQLDVVDDGRGFDPSDTPIRSNGSGFGLRAMRERLTGLSGTLAVESTPGDGTAVAASVPLGTGATA
ncbi:sensor histidine kinase [Luteipulveratus flavus]|uniref:Oxygen sensor histidine kinase NreB n=1 Tax=Luteipulveratus flavus TaxID=3031728 RepID=A0ABT6CC11_9MICO|nr:sensor histidine kinase [Luteipulveratus sp. YIM 133296]MDF8266429.1 sensor histidine kinase [Luteipulveratus sp. YIM 133296]